MGTTRTITRSGPGGGPGAMLRGWRGRRRVSQMELALAVGVSTRHLSFVETGRSGASRGLLGALADELDIPLRERNALLLAAGYAPSYSHADLDDDALRGVRAVLERLLAAHDPYPALVVDRWGDVGLANATAGALLEGVAPELLVPRMNIDRLSLHPGGLAPRIRNLAHWRAHLVHRLERQLRVTGDPRLADLLAEVRTYPAPTPTPASPPAADVVLPLELEHRRGVLSLLSTVTTFGTPHDVTIAELAVETFFPADAATREALERAARERPPA